MVTAPVRGDIGYADKGTFAVERCSLSVWPVSAIPGAQRGVGSFGGRIG